MSYALPRAGIQPARDQLWASSRRARFADTGNGHVKANGISDKVSGVFEDVGLRSKRKGGLPMYKDKPYNYGASGRRARWWKRRRVIAALLLGVVGFTWWFGLLGGANPGESQTLRGKSDGWGLGWTTASSKPKTTIDWAARQAAVKDVFVESWTAYENHAWGFDEFHPISKKGKHMVTGGMGWIIVDALDTLMLMNLTAQLVHAREWVSESLSYEKDHDGINTFETTIRMLGGLLSAHYLSTSFPDMAPVPVVQGSKGEDLYLEKATDLADRLLGAYDSISGIPYANINLEKRRGSASFADAGASSTAEAASLQLEMKYVAKLTGEKLYWDKAEKVMEIIDNNGAPDGLVPIFISPDRGAFSGNNIRLGSRGDSYYEYLIKQYLQTSKQEPVYLSMWEEALLGVQKHLITYSYPSNLTVIAERPEGLDKPLSPKMDHLVCFMPGTIALAVTGGLALAEARKQSGWGEKQERQMALAKELTKTCWGMYKVTKTGLAPEIAHFEIWDPAVMMSDFASAASDYPLPTSVLPSSPALLNTGGSDNVDWRKDYIIKTPDRHNLQRPETVESLFYMWRITGEEVYREWGWEMFEAFVKYTKVTEEDEKALMVGQQQHGKQGKEGDEAEMAESGPRGYTSLANVEEIPPRKKDNMESFWLAETLKYFYLLFGPNEVLPLDQIVLNTEAHPFPRFELGKLFSTGWQRKARDAEGKIIAERDQKGEYDTETGHQHESNTQAVEVAVETPSIAP